MLRFLSFLSTIKANGSRFDQVKHDTSVKARQYYPKYEHKFCLTLMLKICKEICVSLNDKEDERIDKQKVCLMSVVNYFKKRFFPLGL